MHSQHRTSYFKACQSKYLKSQNTNKTKELISSVVSFFYVSGAEAHGEGVLIKSGMELQISHNLTCQNMYGPIKYQWTPLQWVNSYPSPPKITLAYLHIV